MKAGHSVDATESRSLRMPGRQTGPEMVEMTTDKEMPVAGGSVWINGMRGIAGSGCPRPGDELATVLPTHPYGVINPWPAWGR